MPKKKTALVTGVGIVATAGVSLGILAGGFAGNAVADRPPSYEINDQGMSYGSSALAADIGVEPDLIAVLATNGKEGYAKREELNGPMPSSPEEAATWNEKHSGERTVSVFSEDGVTIIGEFVVSSSKEIYTLSE